jgi:hypothetical protein
MPGLILPKSGGTLLSSATDTTTSATTTTGLHATLRCEIWFAVSSIVKMLLVVDVALVLVLLPFIVTLKIGSMSRGTLLSLATITITELNVTM